MGDIPKVTISDESMAMLERGCNLLDKYKSKYGKSPTEDEFMVYEIQNMDIYKLMETMAEMKKDQSAHYENGFASKWLKSAKKELTLRKVNAKMLHKYMLGGE